MKVIKIKKKENKIKNQLNEELVPQETQKYRQTIIQTK